MAYEDLIVDTTPANVHSGTHALRVPNQHGENSELFARFLTLKPGTRYSVSVWMKSQAGNLDATPVLVGNSYRGPAKGTTFTVGQTWQHCAFAFTTDADPSIEDPGHAIWISFNNNQSATANDLWIDDFQVYEDPSSAVGTAALTASGEVEVAVTVDKQIYFGTGNAAAVTVSFANTTSRTVQGSVDLRLDEDFGAPSSVVSTLPISLTPGQIATTTTSLPLNRFGSYTLTPVPHLDAIASPMPACFVAAGVYTPAQAHLDLDTTFCVGANSGLQNGRGPAGMLRACSGPSTKILDVYASMGGRLIRDWDAGDAFWWKTIEPVQGQPQFTRTDFIVKAMYDRGISLMPVLGGDFLTRRTEPIRAPPPGLIGS
jgi:hypothetical protein